jgi:hypothetical protein
MRTAKMAYSLFDLGRSGVEIGASVVSNSFRTGAGFKDIGKSFGTFNRSDWKLVDNLIQQTGSSLGLKDLQREFGHEVTAGRPKTKYEKIQERVISLPEHTTFKMVWLPAFEREFENITQSKFNTELYNNSKAYRDKYQRQILDAAAIADKNTKKVIGGGTKLEGRRYVQIIPRIVVKPFNKYGVVDANSYAGKIAGFFGNYMARENSVFSKGLEKIANGNYNEGIAESTGILLNMMAYSSFMAAYMAAKAYYMEGDDEKGDRMLDELMNLDKITENIGLQIANSYASKYGALGREMLFLSAQAKYSKAKAEDDYKTADYWSNFIKNNLFKKPIDDKEDYYKHMISLETSVGYVIEEAWNLIGGKNGFMELYEKNQKGVELTEDEVARLQLLDVVVTGINIILAPSFGTVVPGKKALELRIKSREEQSSSELEDIDGILPGDVIIEETPEEPSVE